MNAAWTIAKCVGAALAAVWAVWFVVGGIGETGPMGWLNALQQDVFGSYSSKLSVLTGCAVFGFLVLPFAVDSVLNDAAKAVAAPSSRRVVRQSSPAFAARMQAQAVSSVG